jgi:hypothetical protein
MSDALILAKLHTLEGLVRQLLAGNGGSPRPATAGKVNGQRSGGNVASDEDLDSDKGDPKIFYDPKPKYWDGPSYAGMHYSEVTDPAYLDAMAKYLDAYAWAAGKNASEGQDVEKNEKNARFKALDAARARGWAARLRARGTPRSADVALAAIPGPVDDCPF